MIQRSTSDVDTVRRFLSTQLVEAFRSIAMTIIAFWVLFGRDPETALYSVMLIPAMFTASYVFFKRITKNFQLSDASEGKMSAVLQENLTGVRVVRACSRPRWRSLTRPAGIFSRLLKTWRCTGAARTLTMPRS